MGADAVEKIRMIGKGYEKGGEKERGTYEWKSATVAFSP